MIAAKSLGLTLALDLVFEEVPERLHPVVYFGRIVSLFDREWSRPVLVGSLVALVLPIAAAVTAWGVTNVAIGFHVSAGIVVAALLLFSTTSLRLLVRVADDVVEGSASELARAKESVVALVGREVETLTAAEIRSAAVESVAENLSDGLVAPLVAFVIGAQFSLAVGVATAVWVKGVNTLDSMLGYPDKPHGWASARLDDLVMWLPARVTALLLAVVSRKPRTLLKATRWRTRTASPNAGWPMATMAAILDVRLVKSGAYEFHTDASLPSVEEAQRGIRTVTHTGILAFVLAILLVVLTAEVTP